jgi:hypothetical protein
LIRRPVRAAAIALVLIASAVGFEPAAAVAVDGDTTPPIATVELYAVDSHEATFALTASDPSGIAGVRLTCEGAPPIERPFAARLTVALKEGGLGCLGYSVRWVTVEILDTVGNASWGGAYVDIQPELTLEAPLAAVTGQPFTLRPTLPDDYAIPAGGGCRWEFRWGDNKSLDNNDFDETFGSMLFDIVSTDGHCAPWTFTLPWVPYRQYEVYINSFTVEADGGIVMPPGAHKRFTATVGTTERRITTSTLPVVQVLPNTYSPIVGSPVTYTRYLVGGAPACCGAQWSGWQGAGDHPNMWHQAGGTTFTITPFAPGNILVAWELLEGQYRLGALYDPPVRYRDTTRPNTTVPVQRLNGAASPAGASTTIMWSGTDRGWGVDHYTLQRSVDAGAWRGVALAGVRSTSVTQLLPFGHTYRYRVRAVDKAGNVGYWDYGPTFRSGAYQETSASIVYRGTWTRLLDADALGGAIRQAAARGASATFTFRARDVAWVASTGPDHGKANVYIDGHFVGTIDLSAVTPSDRRLVFRRHWSFVGSHSVRIVTLGTAGRPEVDVDAFLVLR